MARTFRDIVCEACDLDDAVTMCEACGIMLCDCCEAEHDDDACEQWQQRSLDDAENTSAGAKP